MITGRYLLNMFLARYPYLKGNHKRLDIDQNQMTENLQNGDPVKIKNKRWTACTEKQAFGHYVIIGGYDLFGNWVGFKFILPK